MPVPVAEEARMPDRFDYELRAIEADRHAETIHNVSIAAHWRDIAREYRLLADFVADATAARLHEDDTRQYPPDPTGFSGQS